MTQTLIYTIPYSKHYTRFVQNDSTSFPYFHSSNPTQATSEQYKYGSKYSSNIETSTTRQRKHEHAGRENNNSRGK
jgi:hypothetical protein